MPLTARVTTDVPTQEATAQEEMEIWHRTFKETRVKTLTLANSPALIMPNLNHRQGGCSRRREGLLRSLLGQRPEKKERVGFIITKVNGKLKVILLDTQPDRWRKKDIVGQNL